MGCCPCAGAGEGAVGLPRAVAPSSRKVVAGGGPPAGGCAHHTNERTTTIDHPSWSLAAAAASNSDPTQRSKPGRQTPFFSIKAPNRLRGHQIGDTWEADLVKSVRTFCFDLDRAGGPFRPPPRPQTHAVGFPGRCGFGPRDPKYLRQPIDSSNPYNLNAPPRTPGLALQRACGSSRGCRRSSSLMPPSLVWTQPAGSRRLIFERQEQPWPLKSLAPCGLPGQPEAWLVPAVPPAAAASCIDSTGDDGGPIALK